MHAQSIALVQALSSKRRLRMRLVRLIAWTMSALCACSIAVALWRLQAVHAQAAPIQHRSAAHNVHSDGRCVAEQVMEWICKPSNMP